MSGPMMGDQARLECLKLAVDWLRHMDVMDHTVSTLGEVLKLAERFDSYVTIGTRISEKADDPERWKDTPESDPPCSEVR